LSCTDRFAAANFEAQEGARARVKGPLHFSTVTALLGAGREAIQSGCADLIDLSGVTESDSSGLALLVEWLAVAKQAKRNLRYDNIPKQIQELAHLSDVEELLIPR
jgi:phospholipid transport system transporter-binding protein